MSRGPYDDVLAALSAKYGRNTISAPTIDEMRKTASGLADLLGYVGPLDDVLREAQELISHRLGEGVSLVRKEAGHDPEWVQRREIDWHYSTSYERYLRESGYPPAVVDTLAQVSRKVAGHLQDPLVEGSWDRRGLVIGHVQSGKTANYLGLLARAADAGYKFIVVVAGVHNNLRQQTQERVDEGFVGEVSDAGRRAQLQAEGRPPAIGVGLFPGHRRPVALTSTRSDFNRMQADNVRGSLNDWSKPVVVVIKKNVTTLKAMRKWLIDFNRGVGQKHIADIPMLFIDDEADNASVNTQKPDLDPTQTNALIREILALFNKSSYVGYTATPFANIFINPDSSDEMLQDDLFPKHFIHCLDAPTNYFGAEKLFLNEQTGARHVRSIRDCEDILPLIHKKDLDLAELPHTLQEAVRSFYLARTIRTLRGQSTKHASMLVNVSRFVAVQKEVRRLIDNYRELLSNAIASNAALPTEIAAGNPHLGALKKTFETEYRDAKVSWEEVQGGLQKATASIKTAIVNSFSDEGLNYAQYADRGEALNVIAVGGLSLSRGLTLEGLTISYMYRNTKMYDTLLQMGRWFGYRPGYEDLCRIWLSDDSIGWYSHIADSAEELRDSIKEMNRQGQTPETFGLMVRSHPDALVVTSANKMRAAEARAVSVSYDGRLIETHVLDKNPEKHLSNLRQYSELFEQLSNEFDDKRVQDGQGERPACRVWRGIPADIVDGFLHRFAAHPDRAPSVANARDYLHRIQDRFDTWDIGFVSLKTGGHSGAQLGSFRMACQDRTAGVDKAGNVKSTPIAPGYHVTSKQRVASPGEESMGLTATEMRKARQIAAEQGHEAVSDRHFRNVAVRGRPLLLLHLVRVLDPKSTTDAEIVLVDKAPAIGIAFPMTGEYQTIEYVLNQRMIEQLQGDLFDNPDDEEDYDREDSNAR